MNPSDKAEFSEVIGGMAVTYRQEATKMLLRAYWLGLSDLSLEAIRQATTRALRTLKFMPTVAELRELAGELNRTDRAGHAWAEFEQAVVAHGSYKSVTFADPIINATVRALGGWMRCCDLPCKEFDKWLRRDFEKTYSAFCAHSPSDEAMRPLAGAHSRANGILGYDHPSNRVITVETKLRPLIEPPEQVDQITGSEHGRQVASQRRLSAPRAARAVE